MVTQTTNLDINHIQEGQNQKEVTANEAFDILDGALAGLVLVDLAGESGDVTPDSDSLIRAMVIRTSGALAASANLIVPDNRKVYMVLNNATAFDVTVKTAAGTGITLSASDAQFLYCDGTNVVAISSLGSTGVTQATEKTAEYLTGTGGTSVLSLAANVDPNTVEVYVDGVRLRRGSGRDYQVTESVSASGDYDQLTPEYTDALPNGANIEVLYYV